MVWQSLEPLGVTYRLLDLNTTSDPETSLQQLCNENTRLLAVSAVQYGSGLRLDWERLGDFCRRRGILFCVDAIQALGAVPFDVQRSQADFVMADGHKWLLGPEGLALFYCRPELRERLRLYQFGWRMKADPDDFNREDWTPSPTASRFECGSPNMLGIHALDASLDLILERGIESIGDAVGALVQQCIAEVDRRPRLRLLSPRDPQRRAGILTFCVEGADQASVQRRLMVQGVICAQRAGGIRSRPH
jgi:Selenocysteine lyase